MNATRTKRQEIAAFFDVDGTIIHTTIVHYFIYYKLRTLSPWRAKIWYPWFLLKCGGYLALDKFSRTVLNRIIYRNYRGFSVADVKDAAATCIDRIAESRWLVGAREEIDRQRKAGSAIVLVTGSLDFLMEPLAMQLGGADVLGARLEEQDGRFTGALVGAPVVAEEKRRKMLAYAEANSIDLRQSHAYGDSCADLPMLESVGFPHAVNPEGRLRKLAQSRGWPIHDWPIECTLSKICVPPHGPVAQGERSGPI